MRSRSKKLLIAAGALVALVIVALLVLPLFLDANAFRPAIEKAAKERLGRDVHLGEMSLSFLPPAVVVADLSVAGSAGGEPWLAAKAVRVRTSWSSLFALKLEGIESVALDEPSIRLLRSPDGRWNLVELMGGAGQKAEPGRAKLGTLSVRKGRISIADAFVTPGSVARLELTDVEARIEGLGGPSMDVDAGATVAGGGRASWKGRVGPGNDVEGRARAESLSFAPLMPYLGDTPALKGIEGSITCDLDVARSAKGTSAKGSATLRGFRLGSAPKGAAPADADATLDVTLDAGGRIDVRAFDVKTGSTSLKVSGSVTDTPGEQVVDLALDAPKASLGDIAKLAAAAGKPLPIDGAGGEKLSAKGKARIVRRGQPREVASVALDGVEISGLRLGLRKDPDGDWHLLGEPAQHASSGPMPAVRVRNVKITDAALRLQDNSVRPATTAEITNLNASIDSWAPGEAGNVAVSAGFAGGTISLKGRVAAPSEDGSGPAWNADLAVKGIDLAQAGALASAAGMAPKAGRADWNAHLAGAPGKDLSAEGRLELKGARMPLASGREVVLDLPIDHALDFPGQGRVRIRRLALGLPGGPLELDGRLQTGDVLRYDIGTKGTARLDPEAVSWLIALAGTALPFDLELSEPLQVDARLRNSGAGLEMSGRADVRKARVRHPLLDQPLDVARATVALQGDRMDVTDAALRLGASALTGSLSVQDFESPRLDFDLQAPEANLDELFAMTAKARTPAPAPGGPGPSLVGRMRAHGRLRVTRATFGGLEMSAFDAGVDLREGRLFFDPADVTMYGGRGTGRLALDMSGPKARFDTDFTLDGVDVRALLQAGLAYSDLSGRGRLVARLTGDAGSLQETLQGLRGEGTVLLTDGEIGNLNALKALEKADVFGERSLSVLAGRLAKDGTPFSKLDGAWTAQDGKLHITRAALLAPDFDIDAKGTTSLLTQRLDLDALVIFAKTISEQMRSEGSRAAQVFWDDARGQVLLPAKLTGTVSAPEATIDWNEAMGRVLQRQRDAALGSILGGGKGGGGSSPSGTSGATGPSGSGSSSSDPLGGLLGSILGGKGGSKSGGGGATTPAPSGTATTQGASEPPKSGQLSVRIDQARMGGSVLAPDLKLKATLSGTDVSHGIVTVLSPDGKELARVERAFEQAVADFYAAAPRDAPAAIPVKLTVPSRDLGGGGPFVVTVVPVDSRGRKGEQVRADVAAATLF